MEGTLKLQTNVPEVIALQFAEGLPVQSQYSGDQVMYSLTDGRKWYVSPFVARKVTEAGITAQIPFEVLKREVARGNRRSVEIQVRNLGDTSASAAAVTTAPVEHNRPADPSTTTQQPNGHSHSHANGNGNGNGQPPAPAPAQPEARPIPTVEGAAAALLARTGKMALDAVLEVEAYAREAKGLEGFTFGPANVQSIWCTLFINATRNGGRG